MSDEPDILDGYPDLKAIAERQREPPIGRLMSEVIGEQASDLAILLAAVRSLIQQTRDLRADEGELSYEVYPVFASLGGLSRQYEPCAQRNTIQDARIAAQEDREYRARYQAIMPVTYEIVAVRRHVVQTVQATG